MILQTLRLRNFRRFDELALEFPENVIGIIGRNGAGKSTLLEAIAWALYGSRATRTEKSLLRRQASEVSEPCEVELTFTLAGAHYRVTRAMRGANHFVEAALYRAELEEPLAVRENDVSNEIEKILGLDRKSFEASIFAKQKELATLSNMRDEERRKLISRLLNLDAIDSAREKVMQDARLKRNFLQGTRVSQDDLEELQKQLIEHLTARQQAEEAWQARQQEEHAWLQKREQAKALFETESQRRDRAAKLQSVLHTLEQQVLLMQQQQQQAESERREILAEREKLAQLAPVREKWQRLKAEKDALEENRRKHATLQGKQQLVKSLTEQIAKLYGETESAQQKLAALPGLVVEEKNLLERLEQSEAALRVSREAEKAILAEFAAIKSRGLEEKQKLQEVEKLGVESPCPVCTRPLAEHFQPVLARLEKNLGDLRADYLKLELKKKEAAAHVHDAEIRLKILQQEREQLGQERVRLLQLQEQLGGQQKRLAELQRQCALAQEDIQKLGVFQMDETRYAAVNAALTAAEEQVQEINRLEARVARLPALEESLAQAVEKLKSFHAQATAAQQEIEQLQFREETFWQCKLAHEEASQNHSFAQKQAGEAHAAFAAAAAQVTNFEQRIAQTRERLAAIAQVEKEVVLLESLQEHFKTFRVTMAGRLRPLIETRAAEIMRMATNGRYAMLELDESYNLFLYDQNQKFELNRFSGGEQDLLNLCLRVAISQVIAQRSGRPALQAIVLDEIFGSQDDERKTLLLATLQHLSGYFRQIFLITHEDSIKENLPVVFEVEMEGDTSVVKVK